MSIYQLKKVQQLPITLDEAWRYFSSPYNLEEITPPDMSFHILTDVKDVNMYPGMVIHYHVSPFWMIKMNWLTEITHVEEKKFFVDHQRVGPYALWHHQHHFKAIPGGVEMTDIVTYSLPMGILGRIAHALFVRKKVEHIFLFREQKLKQLFGAL